MLKQRLFCSQQSTRWIRLQKKKVSVKGYHENMTEPYFKRWTCCPTKQPLMKLHPYDQQISKLYRSQHPREGCTYRKGQEPASQNNEQKKMFKKCMINTTSGGNSQVYNVSISHILFPCHPQKHPHSQTHTAKANKYCSCQYYSLNQTWTRTRIDESRTEQAALYSTRSTHMCYRLFLTLTSHSFP